MAKNPASSAILKQREQERQLQLPSWKVPGTTGGYIGDIAVTWTVETTAPMRVNASCWQLAAKFFMLARRRSRPPAAGSPRGAAAAGGGFVRALEIMFFGCSTIH